MYTVEYLFCRGAKFDPLGRDVPFFPTAARRTQYLNSIRCFNAIVEQNEPFYINQSQLTLSFDSEIYDRDNANIEYANYLCVTIEDENAPSAPRNEYFYFVNKVTPVTQENARRAYIVNITPDYWQTYYFSYSNTRAILPNHRNNVLIGLTDNLGITAEFMKPTNNGVNSLTNKALFWGTQGTNWHPVVFGELVDTNNPKQATQYIFTPTAETGSISMAISALITMTSSAEARGITDNKLYTFRPTKAYIMPTLLLTDAMKDTDEPNFYFGTIPVLGLTDVSEGIDAMSTVVWHPTFPAVAIPRRYTRGQVGTLSNNIELNPADKINGVDMYNGGTPQISIRAIYSPINIVIKMEYAGHLIDISSDLETPVIFSTAAQAMASNSVSYDLKKIVAGVDIGQATAKNALSVGQSLMKWDFFGAAGGAVDTAADLTKGILNYSIMEREREETLNSKLVVQGALYGLQNLYAFVARRGNGEALTQTTPFGIILYPCQDINQYYKNMALFGYTLNSYLSNFTLPLQLNIDNSTNSGASCAFIQFAETNIIGNFGTAINTYFQRQFAAGVRVWYNIEDWKNGNLQVKYYET